MNFFKFLFDFFSQSKNSFGAFLNSDDSRDIKASSFRPPVEAVSLPKKKITDISFIPVQFQKSIGTCPGQATGSEIEYRYWKSTGKVLDPASRRMLYAFCKMIDGFEGQGTYSRLPYKIGTSEGCATARVVPNNNDLSHAEYIDVPRNNAVLQDALRFKPESFISISTIVDEMKREINEIDVFTITIAIDRGAWSQSQGRLAFPKNFSGEYHRVLIFGYEDEGNDTRFYFRNSWDVTWGDKGNGSFLWSDYMQYLFDAMAFAPVPAELIAKAKAEDYIFRLPALTFGQSGEKVYQLQRRLQKLGYMPEGWDSLTGFYGKQTSEAVLHYQVEKSVDLWDTLKELGGRTVGAKTMTALNNGTDSSPKKDMILEWALAIQAFEGWSKGSRSYRTNNPGNIRYSGIFATMAVTQDGQGFCIFKDYDTGLFALKTLLQRACTGQSSVYKPDMTLLMFYKVYAPTSDGNYPATYAKFVADKLSVSIDTQIKTFV